MNDNLEESKIYCWIVINCYLDKIDRFWDIELEVSCLNVYIL